MVTLAKNIVCAVITKSRFSKGLGFVMGPVLILCVAGFTQSRVEIAYLVLIFSKFLQLYVGFTIML